MSCDTEVMAAETFAITGINYIFLIYSNQKVILHCNIILQYYCFYNKQTSFKEVPLNQLQTFEW